MERMTETLQQQLNSLWTTKDLCILFRKTSMTIHLWRKNKGLPALVIPGDKRPTIRFVPEDVIEWANENSIKFKLPNRVA